MLQTPITQVQRHLISQKIAQNPLFTDPEGSYLHFQLKEFIEIVTTIAPNVHPGEILYLASPGPDIKIN